MNAKEINQWASRLVNSSVQDMQCSLNFYSGNGEEELLVLNRALAITTKRGEVTKARMLQAKIKKLEKLSAIVVLEEGKPL